MFRGSRIWQVIMIGLLLGAGLWTAAVGAEEFRQTCGTDQFGAGDLSCQPLAAWTWRLAKAQLAQYTFEGVTLEGVEVGQP